MNITFEEAWQRKDPKQAEEAKAFWEAHGLLPPAQREQRARELVALARSGGEVAGVATAVIQHFPQLRGRFAFFRCAVAPELRNPALTANLAVRTYDIVGGWSLENPGEQVLGIITIVDEREFGDRALQPMWPEHDVHLNLVAYTQEGQQVRVAWFKHARLGWENKPVEDKSAESKQWAI